MALTDTAIRNAKPTGKPYKLADEKGLFLLVQPSGGKLWRLKYRVGGKEKKLALGRYPDIGLKAAREGCAAARAQIASGGDPSAMKRAGALTAKLRAATTFGMIAEEYIAKTEREGRSASTVSKSHWFLALLSPTIADRAITDISPLVLLAALKKVEARGNLDTAHRLRAFAGRVFRYAIATGRAEFDPTLSLRGALVAPVTKHHGALLDPQSVGALLRSIDGYTGQPSTRFALRLAPHVFVRPGELRHAEWGEFELDSAVWKIPATKMKAKLPHVIPLSRQAVAILKEIRAVTGGDGYLFPSLRSAKRPISDNTLNAALRRMGYSGDEMTAHGFRAVASTLLNESGKWSPDAIERALAHKDSDKVRAAYHRGAHWSERVTMAQWWSDHLDALREGAKIIPMGRATA